MLQFACVPWHCWGVVRPAIGSLLSWGRMSGIAIVCVCWLYALAWNGEHHNPSIFHRVHSGLFIGSVCLPINGKQGPLGLNHPIPLLGVALKARSWTLGWVDRSASGVHRLARPFCRRCAPGLNWPGRASGAVTLKKLECSKQAYALDTLAWDNTTGF
ncbi:hypothetical protein KIW84_UN0252 [Lathyrus oleraceus]|nr:hypothetical protein KIW84_UN0252 [Pisum sativum]